MLYLLCEQFLSEIVPKFLTDSTLFQAYILTLDVKNTFESFKNGTSILASYSVRGQREVTHFYSHSLLSHK